MAVYMQFDNSGWIYAVRAYSTYLLGYMRLREALVKCFSVM